MPHRRPRVREVVQRHGEAGLPFDLMLVRDERAAGTADHDGDVRIDPDDLQYLTGVRQRILRAKQACESRRAGQTLQLIGSPLLDLRRDER